MRAIAAHRASLATSPATTTSIVPAREHQPAFSEELQNLATRFADRPTPLSEILGATQGRGFYLLLFCISLPFLTPIPLPGLSTPFGLVVALIGARLAVGRSPWLPRRLLARELPPRFLTKLLKSASRIVRLLEFCLRPRWAFLHEALVFRRVAGSLIMLCGLLLLLPLPLPFSNSLPALTVLLLAASALERDGACFLAGCIMFLVTVAYFGFLAFGGVHLVDNLSHTLLGR
jgi:hypothetical protein